MSYSCHFCERSFHFKEMYENHEPICEFFYKKQRDKTREDEKIEKLPSAQEMYQLVQHLYVELNRQKIKIENMEKVLKRKKRDVISTTPMPVWIFRQWVRQIEVKKEHLTTVFQEDVFEGIKKCINEDIRKNGLVKIPVRTLIESPTSLYIYKMVETVQKWAICDTADILFLVEHLMGEFMRVFCEWEDENHDWISRSIENKDLHVNYLCKITGSTIFQKDRKRLELKNWICGRVRFDV